MSSSLKKKKEKNNQILLLNQHPHTTQQKIEYFSVERHGKSLTKKN